MIQRAGLVSRTSPGFIGGRATVKVSSLIEISAPWSWPSAIGAHAAHTATAAARHATLPIADLIPLSRCCARARMYPYS